MKNLLVIDNNQYYINRLHDHLKKHDVSVRGVIYDEVIDQLRTPSDIADIDLILVDYELGDVTCLDIEISDYIRDSLKYKGPLLLISVHEEFGDDQYQIERQFDAMIKRENEDSKNWINIKKYLIH